MTAAATGAERDQRLQRGFRRALLGGLSAGVLILVALIAVSLFLFRRDQRYGDLVEHSYAAQTKISRLGDLVERMETARRGYLIQPDETYWTTYLETRAKLPQRSADLRAFTIDNPRQTAGVNALDALLAAKFQQMEQTIAVAHGGDRAGALASYLASKNSRLTLRIRAQMATMQAEEQRLLAARLHRERTNAYELESVSIGAATLLTLLVLGGGLLVWRYAADLDRSQAALRGLNAGLEDAVRDRTAELIRANEEIQRFAYIVSHDLRSPLVNVMGFTSELEAGASSLGKLVASVDAQAPGLVDREARSFIADEIPEAIGFIRSSTRKMDRLINAILKLSREGRRTLTPEPLAMDALAQGVADSLHQLAEGKGAVITIDEPLPELVNDRVAIEQLLSNLTENAVKYLSPERPGRVAIRGHIEGRRAVIEVADNGRGIDPKDHERIFELFRRAGQQDQPGEGIGLAHVRALVYRLGGYITVDSELGRGSTFRVDLPRRLERETSQAA